ncbi:MAG: aldo/keto reductase [Planctomycetota bacterium]
MTLPTVNLGFSQISVGRLGLGGGGPSRLGTHGTLQNSDVAIAVVRRAIDLGITLIDTAESYGTEPHIAAAIRDLPASVRDTLVVCTKHAAFSGPGVPPRSADDFIAGIEQSIRTLGVDAIDLEQVHGVEPREYGHVRQEILPALDRALDAGKIRHLGVTEMFQRDTQHKAMSRVLDDVSTGAPWSSIMVGHNLLNQIAGNSIIPRARELRVATLGMFAVRRALSRPDRLAEIFAELAKDPRFDLALANGSDGAPLSWLLDYADSIPEAAYRFCLSEPAPDVILTGTGSIEHLEANVRAIERGPLPAEALSRLRGAFGHVNTVTGH